MTALQVIIKEAKAIRKKMPKIEWKKAVAQASAIYASKHKGKSPVGKKKTVKKVVRKKAAKKKAVGKYVKTVRKGKITDVIYKRKKIGAVKKSATTMHKDTKSHNVNIRVMSGVSKAKFYLDHNKKILGDLKSAIEQIHKLKRIVADEKYMVKNSKKLNLEPFEISMSKNFIAQNTRLIKELETHANELKKHIK